MAGTETVSVGLVAESSDTEASPVVDTKPQCARAATLLAAAVGAMVVLALATSHYQSPAPAGVKSAIELATCNGNEHGCKNLGLGDGDCDLDSDCATGLQCGKDNCGDFRSNTGWPHSQAAGWDLTDDCCFTPCHGRDSGCKHLGLGDGDCDTDDDCGSGLKCGMDNCNDFRPNTNWPSENAGGWDSTDDCCYHP